MARGSRLLVCIIIVETRDRDKSANERGQASVGFV